MSASAMNHGGGRCPARGRIYSRAWGTTSTGGSSGNTPDEETGAVMQVLPSRTTSRATTCCPGWMSSWCGSGLHTPSVLPQPTGSTMMANRSDERGCGIGSERQVPRFGLCRESSRQRRLAPDSFALENSCLMQYYLHTSSKSPPNNYLPLSDLTPSTSDGTPSAGT